ncbi:phenylalanine 4-monooxygenase [Hirschia maritima]|uniref:phenylalanine 4-monooxygenase n=1 Tax=Hirschia maritima TaxID=1121961 RepID=UPI00037146D3|nr:phenylalanine 4-monooxygenase [Hirschia maritima]
MEQTIDINDSVTSSEMEKNRYFNAQRAPDYTIDQDWKSYSPEEHDRWDRLFLRMQEILPGRACSAFVKAMNELQLSASGIPDMEKLSDLLEPITGWRVVPVAGLVPDDVFFDHLANRRFPAGAFIRPEKEFDYLQEPDIFHDIFGHVPMLADPTFADFIQAYGKGGQAALERGQLHNLARIYWYTVEFGLIEEDGDLRIFGAGILSSPQESKFCLEDHSPNRIRFDRERVMRTNYIIDDFQKTYFVISDFETLLKDCYEDFTGVYEKLVGLTDLSPSDLIPEDHLIHRGTQKYFLDKQA